MQIKLDFQSVSNTHSRGDERFWDQFEMDLHEKELIAFLESMYGKIEDEVILAIVFLNLFRKSGHICLPLNLSYSSLGSYLEMDNDILKTLPDSADLSTLKNSAVTGAPGELKPFIIDDESRFYMHKSWSHELLLSKKLRELSVQTVEESLKPDFLEFVNKLFPADESEKEADYQKIAAIASLYKKLIVLSGGPGTGKTTTIAKILALQFRRYGKTFRLALAAPTGKASARMSEALINAKDYLDLSDELSAMIPTEAVTLHRLLQPYNRSGLLPEMKSTLPYDLIVIDEASMMDLTLAHKLMRNLSDDTSVIFVGDKHQLASVEAGAVLGDICVKQENGFSEYFSKIIRRDFPEIILPKTSLADNNISDSIIYLEKNYRFGNDSGIGNLAELVKKGEGNSAWEILENDQYGDVNIGYSLSSDKDYQSVFEELYQKFQQAKDISSPSDLMKHWLNSVWLTPFRYKNPGVNRLNREFERYLSSLKKTPVKNPLFDCKPVLITKNDYQLNLFNGDLGVIKTENELTSAYFKKTDGNLKMVSPSQIAHFESAWFWTVHKSQGSEFDTVHLMLPEGYSPILSKELIYTAITRARNRFVYHGNKRTFIEAISKKIQRFSGLTDKLISTD